MSEFDDIRPYHDSEVQSVLLKTIEDNELIDLIGQLRFGKLYRYLRVLVRPLLKSVLRRSIASVNSVMDFQNIVKRYLEKAINSSTDGLSVEGIDALDLDQPCLFMSNHRDITMDPALTNYALFSACAKTLRIAIGDNLLSKPFAADLMRLNKSFIVKRSISQPRKLLAELKKLSRYIWYSLKEDRQHIWIAHREGRAKDGWDESEPAIVKMLTIAKPKEMTFSDYIRELNIVPVAISYEYDPCDTDKAMELRVKAAGQDYVKDEHEDLESIGKGISGYKGRVTLVFGKPLSGEFESPDDIAKALDQAIVSQYKLHPSNVEAYVELYGEHAWQEAEQKLVAMSGNQAIPVVEEKARQYFQFRISELDSEEKRLVLQMYANPVSHKLQLLD